MNSTNARVRTAWFAIFGLALCSVLFVTTSHSSPQPASLGQLPQDSTYDTSLGPGYRFERAGWIYVHLEGTPHDIGVQHGYLLAPQIADTYGAMRLEMTHGTGRDWDFFRRAAKEMLWPKVDPEYQQELQGIVEGLRDHDVKLDLWDIVAMNAFSELPDYYVPWLNRQTGQSATGQKEGAGHCSAFVATGSWTKDHEIVMAHNNWTTYIEGSRWNIVFDITPRGGYRILMDGIPGVIASDDDFGINSAGIMITETTIARFHGWNPNGKPEFVRSRKAMQYAASIDDFERLISDGNNGGYANDWLLGDRKTGEIARLELGLKHSKLWRTKDGYYSGANFPSDPDVIRDETDFNPNDASYSPNARRERWDQLIVPNRGKIDVSMAEVFLADHYDAYTKREGADIRTLCGHGDADENGDKPYLPFGAVSGKAIDSNMAQRMSFSARIGHPCGTNFDAAKFLEQHSAYLWMSPALRDLVAGPWATFQIEEHALPLR